MKEFNCNGLCHLCKETKCENHPKNYDRELEYAAAMLLNNEEELVLLKKLMNSKMKSGLQVMSFEDECAMGVMDYELTDRDRADVHYVEVVIEAIKKEVKLANPLPVEPNRCFWTDEIKDCDTCPSREACIQELHYEEYDDGK